MTDLAASLLKDYFEQIVVLDLQSMYVCLGKLVDADHQYVVLADADVHDLRETTTTRERYILESRIHGIRANRARVLINRNEIVSISRLDDVVE